MKPEDRKERGIPRWLAVVHGVVSAVVVLMLIAAAAALVVSLYRGADSKYQQMIFLKDKIKSTASGL